MHESMGLKILEGGAQIYAGAQEGAVYGVQGAQDESIATVNLAKDVWNSSVELGEVLYKKDYDSYRINDQLESYQWAREFYPETDKFIYEASKFLTSLGFSLLGGSKGIGKAE